MKRLQEYLTKILNPCILLSFRVLSLVINIAYPYSSFRRFYVLETIARIPYFSYLICLHLYQTLGGRPSLKLMNLHYKENLNEQYHLTIMEELGGDKFLGDRVLARILGCGYYGLNILLFLLAPKSAYYLMELVETEAVYSYQKIIQLKYAELENTKPGAAALEYFYTEGVRMDPPTKAAQLIPDKSNLSMLDVFRAILMDEQVHAEDMKDARGIEPAAI